MRVLCQQNWGYRSQIFDIVSSFVSSTRRPSPLPNSSLSSFLVRSTLSITRHIHNQLRIQPSIYEDRVSIDTSNHHGRSTKLDLFHDHLGSCVDSFDISQSSPMTLQSIPRFHLQSDIDHLQLGTTAIDANGNATMALVRPTYGWTTLRMILCDRSRFPFYRQFAH
ncbi:hypothetical protein EDD22DRAFT_873901, partial [Suillus occidentalis]